MSPLCSVIVQRVRYWEASLAKRKRKCQPSKADSLVLIVTRISTHDSNPMWAGKTSPRDSHPHTTRRFIPAHRRISMKQDARKNSHRRKRQKRRLALKKYRAEKKIKDGGSVKIED